MEQTVPIFTVSLAQFNNTCNSSLQTPSNRPRSLSVRRVEEHNSNMIHLPLVPAPSTASFLGRASWKANTSGKQSPRHILEILRGGKERRVPGGPGLAPGWSPAGWGSLQPRLRSGSSLLGCALAGDSRAGSAARRRDVVENKIPLLCAKAARCGASPGLQGTLLAGRHVGECADAAGVRHHHGRGEAGGVGILGRLLFVCIHV